MSALKPIADLPPDPWGLSTAQRMAIVGMCLTGSQKGAARHAGVSLSTACEHLKVVRKKMGRHYTSLAMLDWDRWHRSQS